MKLTIFNGSPRGKGSNTKILLDHFTKGFLETGNHSIELFYLIKQDEMQEAVRSFQEAECIILAFPLYTDAMPAIVKTFIEALSPFCESPQKPDVGFIVQSGFPEPIHCRAVEKYLEKLSSRLANRYLGTIIKGGVEGIQVQPPGMTRKLFKNFYNLGRYFGKKNMFDNQIVANFTKKERFGFLTIFAFKILRKTGMFDVYWNRQLKKNNAYKIRFSKPYLD